MKYSAFIAVILFALCLFIPANGVSETDSGIFYSIENGVATVEGFNYAGHIMTVPETIEGCPVKYIADQACRGNEAISELRLPSSLVSVGEYAFAECKNLVKVTFSDGTETIEPFAFENCSLLVSVKLPETLKTIDDAAFNACIQLRELKIPASVEKIGTDAFLGCSELRLDVKDSPLAAEYAERYSIPTDFKSSWSYTLIWLVAATAALAGAAFLVERIIKKRRNK